MNERDIFLQAIEIDDAEKRSAYLDTACGTDSALRLRVEALLRSSRDAGSFLQSPAMVQEQQSEATPSNAADTRTAFMSDDSSESLSFLKPSQRPDSLGRLDHYEILEVVGRGGMGIVMRAFDERLQRIVAIKVMAHEIAGSGAARKRFWREAQAAAAVVHDHIVPIYAIEESGASPYLVMQFIEGQSLQDKIDREGSLELKEILRIALQAGRGLAAAHKQGLVHRDIKPANLLLENGVQRVKITDFGLARAVDDATISQAGVIAGTPQYMSPEQADGKPVDHRSDLFSLGSVMYAMCCGRPPFRAESTVATLKRVCEDAPRPIRELNPDMPEWLCDVVGKLHAKRSEDRFQSAQEVAELLEKALAEVQLGNPLAGSRLPEREIANKSIANAHVIRKRLLQRLGTIAIIALVLFGAGVISFIKSDRGRRWFNELIVGKRASVVVTWREPLGSKPFRIVLREEPPPGSGAIFNGESIEIAGDELNSVRIPKVQSREDRARGKLFSGVGIAKMGEYRLHVYCDDKEIHNQKVTVAGTDKIEIAIPDLAITPILDGRWVAVSLEFKGRQFPQSEAKDMFPSELVFKGDQYGIMLAGKLYEGTLWKDSIRIPAAMDLSGSIYAGLKPRKTIYKIEGDRLTLCIPLASPKSDPERPTEFATSWESNNALFIYRRVTKASDQAGPRLLRSFDPVKETPQPILSKSGGKMLSVEGGAWRIENDSNRGNFYVTVATLRDGIPDDGIIICRAKVKVQIKHPQAWGNLELGETSPSFHEYDWPDASARYDSKDAEWTTKEVRYPAHLFLHREPKEIPIRFGMHANGVVWVKDLELLHLPAPASEPTFRREGETVIKSFTFKDRPISRDDLFDSVHGWRYSTTEAKSYHLFSIPKPDVDDCRLIFRMRLKAKNISGATMKIVARFPGVVGVDDRLESAAIIREAAEWGNYEVVLPIPKGRKPERVELWVGLEGRDRSKLGNDNKIWIKDVELLKAPLDKSN